MKDDPTTIWSITEGDSPVIVAAIHDGHALRPELQPWIALDEAGRLREEDPFTGRWTAISDTRVVGLRSRFEVDLNRPREKAIYRRPEDAWGLMVYRENVPEEVLGRSLDCYDAFYETCHDLFQRWADRHGHFVVLDLHSYNHRRAGREAKAAGRQENPEVNVGTATLPDRDRWAPLIDGFIRDLTAFDYDHGHLDVRENVKFLGGNWPRWIHSAFPRHACALSIEFKKFFMDEWTGQPDADQLGLIERALESTIPGILKHLQRMNSATAHV